MRSSCLKHIYLKCMKMISLPCLDTHMCNFKTIKNWTCTNWNSVTRPSNGLHANKINSRLKNKVWSCRYVQIVEHAVQSTDCRDTIPIPVSQGFKIRRGWGRSHDRISTMSLISNISRADKSVSIQERKAMSFVHLVQRGMKRS